MYFSNYGLRKMWLGKCLKNAPFRRLSDKQYVKWSQTLPQSTQQHC